MSMFKFGSITSSETQRGIINGLVITKVEIQVFVVHTEIVPAALMTYQILIRVVFM